MNMSVDKVLEIVKTIATIRVRLPHSNKIVERIMLITETLNLLPQNFITSPVSSFSAVSATLALKVATIKRLVAEI